jgi:ADP-heptose:LPS heptosyltransferase
VKGNIQVKVRLIKKIDSLLGSALVKALSPPATNPEFAAESILFIRPGGIGDAVLLIPTINTLKNKYPSAVITLLAEQRNASAFKLCPNVDKVLLYDKPKELFAAIRGKYDVVIDTEQWHQLSAVIARLSGVPVAVGFTTNERRKSFSHPVPFSHEDYETYSFR